MGLMYHIRVGIDIARIEIHEFEPCKSKHSVVIFFCDIDREGNLISASAMDDREIKRCNDVLWSLIKETNKAWPLGYWESKASGPWNYHGTREEEQSLLEQLNDRYHRMVSKVHVRSNLYNN